LAVQLCCAVLVLNKERFALAFDADQGRSRVL
jgi:hypothetical protein